MTKKQKQLLCLLIGACLLSVIGLCIVHAVTAKLVIQVDDIVASFKPRYAYTISDLTYKNQPIMDVVSGNGSVIQYATTWRWAGSWHGHETVEQTSLTIDNAPVTVQDHMHFTAKRVATFSRTTLLGSGYRLTHSMQIKPHRIDETAHFTGLPGGDGESANNNVIIFYGWLGTRANTLTDYVAYDKNRVLLVSGRTLVDDDRRPHIPMPAGTMAVAQYNPITGIGVLTQWRIPTTFSTSASIHDRVGDNKLYLSLKTPSGQPLGQPRGYDFTIHQSLTLFSAPPETWRTVAAAL